MHSGGNKFVDSVELRDFCKDRIFLLSRLRGG